MDDRNLPIEINRESLPKHMAIIMQGSSVWAKNNHQTIEEAYSKRFRIVLEVMKMQADLKVPVISFYLLPEVKKPIQDPQRVMAKLDSLSEFLMNLKSSEIIHKNGIKITVLGRWYDLPGRIVDSIKEITSETKDYDSYFVNLFINYDGQQEIVDAVRVIGMKIKSGRLDPNMIDKQAIKDELYTSYFMPPELIIRTGTHHRLRGFLLWDSIDATIYFSNKLWPDISCDDLIRAIRYHQNMQG